MWWKCVGGEGGGGGGRYSLSAQLYPGSRSMPKVPQGMVV